MDRLMIWRSGNNNNSTIVVDDLTSWEIVNPSDDDDVRSLSDTSSVDESGPEAVSDQKDHERSGSDDPDLGVDMVVEQILSESNIINQQWRFDEDEDQQPGFDDPDVGLAKNLLPDLVPDQISDERSGFDDHSAGLWEYTEQLMGLGQFDDNAVSDPPAVDQHCGFNKDPWDELSQNVNHRRFDEYTDCYDDDDYDDGEYDFDDNLVPFSVSNKFGKQRLGKVGKKVNAGAKKVIKKMPRHYYKTIWN